MSINNFDFKNIKSHKPSTFVGLVVLGVMVYLLASKVATYVQVSPLLFFVVSFLLYGKDKTQRK